MSATSRGLILLALAACGGGERRPGAVGACQDCNVGQAGSGGHGAGGQGGDADGRGGSADAGTGSDAPDAAAPGASGAGGASSVVCGNGIREAGEACDGEELGGLTCASVGYLDGEITCSETCTPVVGGCTGTERCADGSDNDGDGLADCADSDCDAACQDQCAAPTPLLDGSVASGKIAGQQAPALSSCVPFGGSSTTGQVIFAYTPPLTGIAQLFLDGPAGLAMSLREDCADADSELECVESPDNASAPALQVHVNSGETLFIVVESDDRSTPSDFQLVASAHEVACGDGYVDLSEQCDDANFVDADGCSDECRFTSDEDEPNSSIAAADTLVGSEFNGEIRNVNDIDVLAVTVSDGQSLVVDTHDLGGRACEQLALDNRLELLSAAGEVLASDDDGGTGFCATLQTGPLAAGTYYVSSAASGTARSFLYRLVIGFGS